VAGASLLPNVLTVGRAAWRETSGEMGENSAIKIEPFRYNGVRLLDGMLKKQAAATRDFYFNLADESILLGFRRRAGLPAPGQEFAGYGADHFHVFGQWLSGMARMSKATGDAPLAEKANYLMLEWGKAIDPDGYFFYSRHPNTYHYTYEKTVCGLVDLYEYGGRKEALPLLAKITGWAINNLDRARVNPTPKVPSGVGGCEWYTLCENLYRAYQLTGDSTYKTFGDLWRYPAYWEMFTGSSEPTPQGLHGYSHCNTLSSAAMTYAITGEQNYLRTVANAYDYFERTQFYATGGYGPGEKLLPADGSLGESIEQSANTFETPCGSWGGLKLAKYLMEFTGQARYGDWIEKLVYNGIGAALPMGPGGKTYYYSDYRLNGGQKVYFRWPFPCCSGTYLQAVADYHDLIYFHDASGLYVNLFVPSELTWNYQGAEFKVEQETAYPESDFTALVLRGSRSAAFDLKIRVPQWTPGIRIEVNGTKITNDAPPGTWATVSRTWRPGDRIVIRIPMRLRLAPIDAQHPRRVALMYGPVVLALDQGKLLSIPGGDPARVLSPAGKNLEFRLHEKRQELFVPFYRVGGEQSYSMYFDV
jgi:DUF1680 family protein